MKSMVERSTGNIVAVYGFDGGRLTKWTAGFEALRKARDADESKV